MGTLSMQTLAPSSQTYTVKLRLGHVVHRTNNVRCGFHLRFFGFTPKVTVVEEAAHGADAYIFKSFLFCYHIFGEKVPNGVFRSTCHLETQGRLIA